jgi:hypothetical protein
VRATSQGFAYNFGRILAAVGTLLSPIFLLGVLAICFAPRTTGLADAGGPLDTNAG